MPRRSPPNSKTKKKRGSSLVRTSLQISGQLFKGPLPHPEILEKYEKILKGSADRIIKMAENQSKHRQVIEKKVISSDITNEKTGMVFAFLTTLILVLTGGYLIYSNKQVVGFLTLLGTLGIQTYNFYSQKKSQKEELKRKKEERKPGEVEEGEIEK